MNQERDGVISDSDNEVKQSLNVVSLVLKKEFISNYLSTQITTCIDLCEIDIFSSIPENKLSDYEMCIRKFNKLCRISGEKFQGKIQLEIIPNLRNNLNL